MTKRIIQQIGSKGGKATASKRTPEQRSEAARKAARARWPTPDLGTFEALLSGRWFSHTSGRERDAHYSAHWVNPLLDAGYAALDREVPIVYPDKPSDNWTEIYYRPTEAGMQWWILSRIAEYGTKSPELLAKHFEGKGVCGKAKITTWSDAYAATFEAMRQGIVEFSSKPDHPWSPGFERSIVVSLTRNGMEYFDSLPKIEYDLNC